MPSSVVHAGFAVLVAAGLLGTYYDRRALVVLVGVLILPEADTLAGLVLDGAHRALLHTMLLPLVLAPVLYWDTRRADSWLRARFGAKGVRLAWVGLFVHVFAHVALDWYHLAGVNLFYPVVDRFFQLGGEAYHSSADGFVQTFVEIGTDPESGSRTVDAGQGGTTKNTHVANPAQPSDEPEPGPTDRRAPIAVQGWQLFLVVSGLVTVAAKRLQGTPGAATAAAAGGDAETQTATSSGADPTVEAETDAPSASEATTDGTAPPEGETE